MYSDPQKAFDHFSSWRARALREADRYALTEWYWKIIREGAMKAVKSAIH